MSASRYRETLHKWASQFVPDGATVTSVNVNYDDGYDPTFTDVAESLSVTINYEPVELPFYGMQSLSMEQFSSVGELLTELFAIEEAT